MFLSGKGQVREDDRWVKGYEYGVDSVRVHKGGIVVMCVFFCVVIEKHWKLCVNR